MTDSIIIDGQTVTRAAFDAAYEADIVPVALRLIDCHGDIVGSRLARDGNQFAVNYTMADGTQHRVRLNLFGTHH